MLQFFILFFASFRYIFLVLFCFASLVILFHIRFYLASFLLLVPFIIFSVVPYCVTLRLVHCESCVHSCPSLYPDISWTLTLTAWQQDWCIYLIYLSGKPLPPPRSKSGSSSEKSGFCLVFPAIILLGTPCSSPALEPVVSQDWSQWSRSLPVICPSLLFALFLLTLLAVPRLVNKTPSLHILRPGPLFCTSLIIYFFISCFKFS